MRALLVFPPQWMPNEPYLAPAALVAYLRREGIKASQVDLNLRFYRWLLTRERIEEFACAAERINSVSLDLDYRIQWALALSTRDYVLEKLDEAVRTFSDTDAFYDLPRYRKAQIVINRACDLVSAAIHPSRLTYQDFLPAYSIESTEGVRQATQDEQTNPFLRFYREEVLPQLRHESGPSLLGITLAANSQIVPGLSLARLVKQTYPHMKVVVGGYIFGSMIREGVNLAPLLDWVDFAIVGDGELSLTELIHTLESGGTLASVPGLVYRDEGGTLRRSKNHFLDLDTLPLPDYSDLDLEDYFLPEPCLPIYSSDGCYYGRCTFCSDSTPDRRYRCKSPERVVEDVIAQRERYGVRHFTFGDDSVAPGWLSRFCEQLLTRSMDVFWECRARIEPAFNRELLGRMRQAGCRGLYLGLETASSRLLRLLQKGITISQAEKMMADCKSVGIPLYIYMISRIPGETTADSRQTLDFMVRHRDEYVGTAFTPFQLRPGSVMARQPQQFGISRVWRRNDLEFEGLHFQMQENTPASAEPGTQLADDIYEAIKRTEGEKNSRHHPKGSGYIYLDSLPDYEIDAFLYKCRFDGACRNDSPAPAIGDVGKIDLESRLRPAAAIRLHESGDMFWVFDATTGCRHALSRQAFWLLKSLENGMRVDDLVDRFARPQGLPVSSVRAALLTFFMDLMKRGLVEQCGETAASASEVRR